ncbi:MAG: hypothetical protein FWE03_06175 [Firmicutes bacterium]|nr:hypothetical protein [Bacillota bacterium]
MRSFWVGLGLGAAAGAYFYKNNKTCEKVFDDVEDKVMDGVDKCKNNIKKKRKAEEGIE